MVYISALNDTFFDYLIIYIEVIYDVHSYLFLGLIL